MGDPCTENCVLKMLELVSLEEGRRRNPFEWLSLVVKTVQRPCGKSGKYRESMKKKKADIFVPHKAQYSTAMLLTLKMVS